MKADAMPDTSGSLVARKIRHPFRIPFSGWWGILQNLLVRFVEDSVMLVAAGVAFYVLLALFPTMLAIVSLYGFFANPEAIPAYVSQLDALLPQSGVQLIQDQLQALATQNTSTLSIGFIFGLTLALWTSNGGMKSMFEAMNIAYREKETRSFVVFNALSALFTFVGIGFVLLFMVLVAVVPVVLNYAHYAEWSLHEGIIQVLRWMMIVLIVWGSIVCIYRYGPDRERSKWRWLSVGATIATLAWIGASWGYSFYLSNFANYSATYGSLGAIIGFMIWLWISAVIVIVGAQLNAQIEDYLNKAAEPQKA